jgi:hypothetical protein
MVTVLLSPQTKERCYFIPSLTFPTNCSAADNLIAPKPRYSLIIARPVSGILAACFSIYNPPL